MQSKDRRMLFIGRRCSGNSRKQSREVGDFSDYLGPHRDALRDLGRSIQLGGAPDNLGGAAPKSGATLPK
jgi:hypothetical protein